MSYRIITISREYGSGGRMIAQKVAEALSLVYYDNEIIDMAAQELGFDVHTIRKIASSKSSSFAYTLNPVHFSAPLNDQVYTMQSKIIRHLASQDPCIIVNGCADYFLENDDQVLKVFIHAPLESRIKRVKEIYQEQHEDYKKAILKQDKRRLDYYNYYTTNKWGDLKNFDLTFNSDLGLDLVAKMIAEAYRI